MKWLLIFLLGCSYCIPSKSQDIPRWKITDLEAVLQDTTGPDVQVINMWATFCKPCIAEIPAFIHVVNSYGGKAALWLVSVDLPSAYPEAIRKMARQKKFTAPIAWLDETNADYFCPRVSPEWSGSIPATLVINRRSGFRKFVEDEMTEEEIRQLLDKAFASGQ